jgi:hypothetical protein
MTGSCPRQAAGNGDDLIETDAAGEPERWVEVKAMTGARSRGPWVCHQLNSNSHAEPKTNIGSTLSKRRVKRDACAS